MNPHEFLFTLKLTAIIFIPVGIAAILIFAAIEREYRGDGK